MAQRKDVVKVAPGIYSGNINLRSGISLFGSGADVTILSTDSGNTMAANNVSDVVVEGFTLEGQDRAHHALYLDCRDLQRTITSSQSPRNVIFRNNVVRNYVSTGISGAYTNITIQGNTLSSLSGDGINLLRAFSEITNNEISLTRTGISIRDAGGSIVEHNVIQDCSQDGILCYALDWLTIGYNSIEKAGAYGIRTQYAKPIIQYNRVVESARYGIFCEESSPKIRWNIITGNHEGGIFADHRSRPDLGRYVDLGNNSIHSNGGYDVSSRCLLGAIMAIGNWWGNSPPRPEQFHGNIDYGMALEEQPAYQNMTP
jgi:parallel beta-helix repeat protein